MSVMAEAPLNDPSYEPRYTPENGRPPAVVAKWGPRSQLRWFRRFRGTVKMKHSEWEQFYCSSVEHKGLCCLSCAQDEDDGYYDMYPHCCCYGLRASKGDRTDAS